MGSGTGVAVSPDEVSSRTSLLPRAVERALSLAVHETPAYRAAQLSPKSNDALDRVVTLVRS